MGCAYMRGGIGLYDACKAWSRMHFDAHGLRNPDFAEVFRDECVFALRWTITKRATFELYACVYIYILVHTLSD